jgi:hypothetical protein
MQVYDPLDEYRVEILIGNNTITVLRWTWKTVAINRLEASKKLLPHRVHLKCMYAPGRGHLEHTLVRLLLRCLAFLGGEANETAATSDRHETCGTHESPKY